MLTTVASWSVIWKDRPGVASVSVNDERSDACMRIHRSHPDEQFAIIPNATLRDHRLSALARSILFDLLSHADGWETNADACWRRAQQAHGEKVGEGRRAHRAAFAELEKYGYMVRRTVKVERGRFATVVDLYDTPGHQSDATGGAAQANLGAADARGGTTGGTPVNGMAVSGTSVTGTSSRSTNQRSTNEEDAFEEHPTSLVDTRAADAVASARERINAERERLNNAVRQLVDADLRDFMWKFENRRPRVYRQCRRDAEARLLEKYPHLRKVTERALIKDQMTYMYALLHYMPKPPEKYEWEPWVVRPLTEIQQSREAA